MSVATADTAIREKALAVFFAAVLFAFSSDLRVGLNLQLDARPDFQFFELVCILFALLLVFVSPWLILRGRLAMENEDHLLVFFLLNAFFLALWAEDPLHNVSRAKDFFWAFALYALLRHGPLSRRAAGILVRAAVLLAFAWSVLGIVQWLGWDEGLGGGAYKLFLASQALYKTAVDPFAGEVLQVNFAHGIYLYPQNFIYYLLCPFFLSLGLARRDKRWLVPAAVILAAMLGTLSKTFVLLLAVFVALCVLYRLCRNLTVAVAFFAALAGLAVLAVILFGHYPFWARALETFVWRLEIWADAMSMLRENPWLLVTGDGTALLASTYSRVSYPNPHNMFLYFLIEYGLAGAVLFFAFFFLRLRRLSGDLGRAEELSPEGRMLFWGMLLFVSMGIVDDMFVQTQITALFFFYLGLLSRLFERGGDEGADSEGKAVPTGGVAS